MITQLPKLLTQYPKKLLRLSIILMIIISLGRLSYEFWRLLIMTDGGGDMINLSKCIRIWFAEGSVCSLYFPASHMLLYPLLGWLDFSWTRYLWGSINIITVAWMIRLLLKECQEDNSLKRWAIILFICANYATAITIGVGQQTFLVLTPLLAGILLMKETKASWKRELLISFLFIFALIKPHLSAPFIWIPILFFGSWKAMVLISSGYILLTLLGTSYVGGLTIWLTEWKVMVFSGVKDMSYGNIHSSLESWGLEAWSFPTSLFLIIMLGVWMFFQRNKDLWLIIGITAIFTRFWAYQMLYHDFLIVFPLVYLYRLLKMDVLSKNRRNIAGLLLFLGVMGLLAPATPLRLFSLFGDFYRFIQVSIWIGLLAFLFLESLRKEEQKIGNNA